MIFSFTNDLSAIRYLEEGLFGHSDIADNEHDHEVNLVAAYQHLINSGTVWRLERYHGQAAATLIHSGLCVDPRVPETYHVVEDENGFDSLDEAA